MAREAIPQIVIHKLAGIVVFFVILILLNIISLSISNHYFHVFVEFLNGNVLLLLLIAFLLFSGDIFRTFRYPYNIPSVLFITLAAMLILVFLIRTMALFDILAGTSLSPLFDSISSALFLFVAVIMIIAGIFSLFFPGHPERRGDETDRESDTNDKNPAQQPYSGSDVSWEDVGREFRRMLIRWFKGA